MDGVGNSFGLSKFSFIFLMNISDIKSNLYFSYWFYYLVYNFGCKKFEVTVKKKEGKWYIVKPRWYIVIY